MGHIYEYDVHIRTKETFVDGWVRTGDEVKFEKNGDVFVVDRLKVACLNIHIACILWSANYQNSGNS